MKKITTIILTVAITLFVCSPVMASYSTSSSSGGNTTTHTYNDDGTSETCYEVCNQGFCNTFCY